MIMRTRWFIAIPLALVSLALGALVYPIGFFLGGMATDSCSNMPGFLFGYLEFLWPLVMGICAIIPAVLIIRKIRWRLVFLTIGGGLAVSLIWYVLWFVILQFAC
jgi:hypothetical protein